ncbi:MAG: DNA-damage-inducible protein [Desmonostoc geniculatum HA4340-LM1]|jgi:DNA-damage-inducible protein D|nr:DNA-damage-inducible protein [Desmonostoc geniculatum HA4340-LM1]
MSEIALTNDEANPFDQIKQVDADGVEYWLATELLTLLGYKTWKRIKDVVERAKISINNSGLDESCHLDNVVQMAQIGDSQAFRETLKDFKLSRHACYLVAINGDPRKSEIAAAQNYFAVKTREAELAPQSNELLSQLLQKFEQQNQVIEEQGRAIALLQSQVQNLLPLPADFIPPGWDAEVWDSLPPQDKRHFKYLYRRRGFRPGSQAEVKALPAVNRELERAEIERLINDVPKSEKELFETAKRVSLQRFWAMEGKS